MVNQIFNNPYRVNPAAQPIRRESGLTTQQQVQKFQVPAFGSSMPTAKQAPAVNPFSQKHAATPLAASTLEGARSNHSIGLSPMAQGALGENAVHCNGGRLGTRLNCCG